jgi:hypothetical protein
MAAIGLQDLNPLPEFIHANATVAILWEVTWVVKKFGATK